MKNYCLRLALFVFLGITLLSVFSEKALAKDSYGFTWTVAATPSAVVVDSTNNIYYAGYLASSSAVQMDPNFNLGQSSDIRTATTGAIFLTKMNSDLSYNTSYIIEADAPNVVNGQNTSMTLTKIATDSANNVYLLGSFMGNVNFDPTGGKDFHSSNGQTWSYLLKMDANGTYGGVYFWQNNNITVRDIAADKSGNIFLLGQLTNNGGSPITFNLNPVGGTDNKTVNPGETMAFYTKLTGANTYGYSKTFKNTGSQYLEADRIATTSAGNIFLYGVFAGTMNFNGGGTDNKTSSGLNDIYLSEYDASGNYLTTYAIGGTGAESAGALAIDNNDNIYYSGSFNGNVNFDPTGGSDSKSAAVPDQRFLTKLNSDGSYGYTLVWDSNTLTINKIAFDHNNLMYLVGISTGDANYDPIGNTDGNQPVFGGNDGFMTVINPDETYNYTYVWGGINDEKAQDAAFDSSGDIYIAGSTKSLSVNFDPTGQTSFPVSFDGGENGYITQFSATQLVVTPPPTNNSNNSSGGSSSQSWTCTSHIPVAPKIFQIWATQTNATIYFVPSADPQDSYTINYGLYSDAEMYNTTFSWSDKSGAIPYTINALAANTPYYFKVRANNGCMPGEWSNTLNLKTALATSGANMVYAPSAQLNSGASAAGAVGSCSQYTVQPGDSFWKIAQNLLGAGNKYLQIWNANKAKFPALNYSSTIRTGWTLSVGC
jgi:hypothetical protein